MNKRILMFGGGAIALVAIALVAVVAVQLLRSDDPNLATEAPQITATAGSSTAAANAGTSGNDGAAAPAGTRKFVIVPAESSAKYVVEETLRGLVTNAVGTTNAISGEIYLTPTGLASRQTSQFRVDLSTLKSDESMRDNFIRQNTLQTNRFQFAEFTVKSLTGFPADYAANTQVEMTLTGTLKIRNIEKDVEWKVLARQSGNTLTATADTDILFRDFGMTPPSVPVATAKEGIHIQVVLVAREG
jgi:polyisoprenoid-binding protein YceI